MLHISTAKGAEGPLEVLVFFFGGILLRCHCSCLYEKSNFKWYINVRYIPERRLSAVSKPRDVRFV